MNLRTSILILVLLGFSVPLFSQTEKGFKYIKKGKLDEAALAFQQDIDDKTMSAFAHYGLAKIYSDTLFSAYNLDTAWGHWLAFDVTYKMLKIKIRDKYRKPFKIKSFPLKNKICTAAFEAAQRENTVEGFNHFLVFYKKSKINYRNTIAQKRNQLAYENALKANNIKGFEVFLEKYKKSLKSKSSQLWKEGQKRLFEISMRENGWKSFQSFAKKYPRNPYVKDSKARKYLAIYDSNEKAKYQDFLDNYPTSLYQKFAKNKLAEWVLQNGTLEEFNWFLLSYPDGDLNKDLWKKFFALYKEKNGKTSVATFANSYPQYPFSDEINADIAAIQMEEANEEFEIIKHSTNVNAILVFLEKYPDSPFLSQLETILLQEIQKHPSIYNYEKFIALFPDSDLNPTLAKELYAMSTYTLTPSSIEKFTSNYGQLYQDSARFAKDLALAERFIDLYPRDYDDSQRAVFDQFIKDAAPHRAAFDVLTRILEKDFQNENWMTAKKTMESYQPYFQTACIPYTQLLDALQAPFQNIALYQLGSAINADGSQYAPVISADGKTLYFCGRRRANNLGKEDIFISQKINGQWSSAKLVREVSTTLNSEAPEAISVDGTQLTMFRSGRLCFSNQTYNGWSEVEFFPKTINATKWQADASISSDGKAMLFVSSRDDIIGKQYLDNKDIYVCLKNEKGAWGEVINLGSQINTPYMERTPFLHPDMRTLYFSSTGHGGFGELDVFKSTRLDDSWTNWSTPVNLGQQINTLSSDWGYKITTDGKKAYFSFSPEGTLMEKIYEVELPQAMRPESVSTIAGVLKNSEGKPLDAEIIIEDLTTGKIVATLRSNPKTGDFFAVLPDNRKYSYYIKKENYFPIANNIDLTNNETVAINEDLAMYTVDELTAKGVNITLENIFFDTDKYELQPASFSELNRLYAVIKTNNFKVELMGHTDSDGDAKYNLQLSQKRADAVKDYLIKKGIPAQNISAKGWGESQPIQKNDSEEGKAKNRRVEIRFF